MGSTEKEVWKKVIGWEEFYEVSTLGKLRRIPYDGFTKSGNKHHFRGGVIKCDTKGKYDYAILKHGGKEERFMVGSLIFKTFNGEFYKSFKYLDGDFKNNSLKNLIPIPEGSSLCNICVNILEDSYFYKDNTTYCKSCCLSKSKNYAKENKEQLKVYRVKYNCDNKESIRETKKI